MTPEEQTADEGTTAQLEAMAQENGVVAQAISEMQAIFLERDAQRAKQIEVSKQFIPKRWDASQEEMERMLKDDMQALRDAEQRIAELHEELVACIVHSLQRDPSVVGPLLDVFTMLNAGDNDIEKMNVLWIQRMVIEDLADVLPRPV